MKLFTIGCLTLCLALTACDRGPGRASAAPEAAFKAERDQYQDYVGGRLSEFEHRFDGLEARMKGLADASQEQLRTDIAELRGRKDSLEQKFKDLKGVSDESWLDVKSSLDREMDELEVAYNLVAANNHGSTTHPPAQ